MKNLTFLCLLLFSTALFACGTESSNTESTNTKTAKMEKATPIKVEQPLATAAVGEGTATPVSQDNDATAMPVKEVSTKAVEAKTKPTAEQTTKKTAEQTTQPTKTEKKVVEATPVKKETKKVVPKATENAPVVKKTPITPAVKSTTEATKDTPAEKKELKPIVKKPAAPMGVSHDAWDAMLRKNVSSAGKVNYKAFKAQQAALDQYLKTLSDNPVQASWSRNEKMAYWINAYNAYTIKLIVDNYPVASITDLHGGKPWDKKWIKLGSKTYSLNNIENDILRPQFKDARIHFAVNCAAKSCPPILNRAWTAKNLNSNFEKQAKAFINNNSFNTISADKVEVSKIFDWYKEDFGKLINYLNKYANTKINAGAAVSYKAYNWKLNE